MQRMIKSMENKYQIPSLELVENVFTAYQNPEEEAPRKASWSAAWWKKSVPKNTICRNWNLSW